MKLEYAYIVTCEKLDGSDVRVSGACYHNFDKACKFIERRSDRPVKTVSPMIWEGGKFRYKIHPLTFDD